jgi:two-component system sensor histidine kinase/response regulator
MPHSFQSAEDPTAALPPAVLVVDNDPLSLQIIAQALAEAGYRVARASTPSEGVRQAQEEQPALIIANVGMPHIDSAGLVDTLKRSVPEASLIAMTDYGAEQLAANALKQGVEEYLIRPVHPWEIVAAAADVLERADLRRRNRELSEALRQRQAELEQRNVELEEANARLREADMWKESLSSMIIHDLRNPLGVIQGTLVFLKGTVGDELNENQSQLLESAMISSDRALKLVSAILDVNRLEEGRMPLSLQSIPPEKAFRACLDEIQPLLAMHHLTASLAVPPDLPPVCADYSSLIRIIANLMDNAIKFTPSGGKIMLSAQRVPSAVQFSVADNGHGIPPEQHERIFEKFAQAGIRAEGQRAGVGLGLTFCKLAVEAQHGRIWVESHEGTGATFHFTLPVWTEEG